jgi:hypothetical protein
MVNPANGGTKTELIYCMYIDPGFPVPQWIIREGVKSELPKTLTALRQRIQAVCEHPAVKEKRTILAALMKFPYRHSNNNSNRIESINIDNIHTNNSRAISLAEQQVLTH